MRWNEEINYVRIYGIWYFFVVKHLDQMYEHLKKNRLRNRTKIYYLKYVFQCSLKFKSNI